jgi:Flp pilus assembly protein TadG
MELKVESGKYLLENGRKKRRWQGLCHSLRPDHGTSILELALLTPLLLLLVLGIIEIGRYSELSILVANAARAGVQYGAQNLAAAADTNGAQNAAVNDAPNALAASANNSTPVCVSSWGCYYPEFSAPTNERTSCPSMPPDSCPPATSAVYIQVNTHAIYSPLFSYPGLPGLVPVSGMARMRIAQ